MLPLFALLFRSQQRFCCLWRWSHQLWLQRCFLFTIHGVRSSAQDLLDPFLDEHAGELSILNGFRGVVLQTGDNLSQGVFLLLLAASCQCFLGDRQAHHRLQQLCPQVIVWQRAIRQIFQPCSQSFATIEGHEVHCKLVLVHDRDDLRQHLHLSARRPVSPEAFVVLCRNLKHFLDRVLDELQCIVIPNGQWFLRPDAFEDLHKLRVELLWPNFLFKLLFFCSRFFDSGLGRIQQPDGPVREISGTEQICSIALKVAIGGAFVEDASEHVVECHLGIRFLLLATEFLEHVVHIARRSWLRLRRRLLGSWRALVTEDVVQRVERLKVVVAHGGRLGHLCKHGRNDGGVGVGDLGALGQASLARLALLIFLLLFILLLALLLLLFFVLLAWLANNIRNKSGSNG
mmetsp:Transcript_61940/g.177674  ORF Transcript_61940/g.177674 Transcript_61940/m.177674 type:complete len:402 (-) Transcript_61940:7-1212(-)